METVLTAVMYESPVLTAVMSESLSTLGRTGFKEVKIWMVNVDSGHVGVFKYNGSKWDQFGEDLNGEASGDRRCSVDISNDGNIVAIGGFAHDGNGVDSGYVQIFEYIRLE